jgi:hypothetical protein
MQLQNFPHWVVYPLTLHWITFLWSFFIIQLLKFEIDRILCWCG